MVVWWLSDGEQEWCLLLLASCGPVALGSLNTYKNALSVAERTFFGKRPVV